MEKDNTVVLWLLVDYGVIALLRSIKIDEDNSHLFVDYEKTKIIRSYNFNTYDLSFYSNEGDKIDKIYNLVGEEILFNKETKFIVNSLEEGLYYFLKYLNVIEKEEEKEFERVKKEHVCTMGKIKLKREEIYG